MKDIVVIAGAPWSVLSFCKVAYKYNRRAFVICFDSINKVFESNKYVTQVIKVNSEQIVIDFLDFFDNHNFIEKPILFAASDIACEIIAQYRSFFENKFIVSMPNNNVIELFINKDLADIEAKKNGLITPLTKKLQSPVDIDYVLKVFSFPIILKPCSAKDLKTIGFKFKICNKEQFQNITNTIIKNKLSVLCQEYIRGCDSDSKFYIFYRNEDGVIIDCMGEKTLQTNGIMTVGTVMYNDELSRMSRTFLNSIDYVGIGGIEYKLFKKKYYFIEMSTRSEGFLPISDMAGCSIAESAYLDICGIGLKSSRKNTSKVRYVVLFSIIINRLSKRKYFTLINELVIFLFNKNTHFVEINVSRFSYYFMYYIKKIFRII